MSSFGETTPSSNSSLNTKVKSDWTHMTNMEQMLSFLRSDREILPGVLEEIDEQVVQHEPQGLKRPVDLRRVELINRLLELLMEQSFSSLGVLQSAIVSMFASTGFTHASAFFYTPEEIDDGCTSGPSEPLSAAVEVGVDDRLVVTIETFESMVRSIKSFELARLLDAFADYVQAMETAWQVTPLEQQIDGCEAPKIKSASGIAVWGDRAYVADSSQHVVFRVKMVTDEVTPFCGMWGKPGFHDGPREMAKFNSPSGLAICESTSMLYVCDTGNDAIRTISIPSGVVQTLSISSLGDADLHLENPIGICIVRGEYEYRKEGSEDEDEEDDTNVFVANSATSSDEDEEGLKASRAPLLEGITEEDEDLADSNPSSTRASFSHGGGARLRPPQAWYSLANEEPRRRGSSSLAGRLHAPGNSSKTRRSMESSCLTPRRTSYMSSHTSRRTSGNMTSSSSHTSRRTSSFSLTMGESAKDSLKECTGDDEQTGYSLAVTGDHCVYLVRPENGDLFVLAGSPTEYGYKDSETGADARFSSLKGVTCIRNCLFVADHWNNVIRCINLKTRRVDSVIDFQPCGPISLAVSSAGNVYVLDSEYISVCNILKICSLQCSTKDAEGALGTKMFQMIQESTGRARSAMSSRRSSVDSGSSRASSRRGSLEFEAMLSSRLSSRRNSAAEVNRRASQEKELRRKSIKDAAGKGAGSISNLGPRLTPACGPSINLLPPALSGMRSNSKRLSSHGATPDRHHSSVTTSLLSDEMALPVMPHALKSLVPGASLHPALIQMTLRSRSDSRDMHQLPITGSQYHVSVVSSADDEEEDDELQDKPESLALLNPKHESPWKRIPIGTLQYVYQEATGQCNANTPLTLAYWDAASSDATAGSVASGSTKTTTQHLLVGGAEWPSLLKVLPPRKAASQERGRFRAVAVDADRVIMADSDSHQIFVINHAKHTKDKIAGCGKAGYLDGPLDVCRMNQPSSVALDPNTHYLYVADAGNHRIRRIDLSTGFMSTVAGNGVKGNRDGGELHMQSLDSPFDIHFMNPCHVLISCADNSIRRLNLQTSQLETILIGS